jgi:hypothetical protein
MTAAVLDAPATLFADCVEAAGPRSPRPARRGRATLAELLDCTWRTARTQGQADCPICHATMRVDDDAARCEGCGSTLS